MRKILFLTGIISLLHSAAGQDETQSLAISQRIDSLVQKKSFFAARNLFISSQAQLIEFDKLLIGASIDNAFNNLSGSNSKIETLFSEYKGRLTDTSIYSLLNLQQINY